MRSFYLYQTSLGKIWIAADENAIYRISFFEIWDAVEKETPAIREAYNQICDYLHEKEKLLICCWIRKVPVSEKRMGRTDENTLWRGS